MSLSYGVVDDEKLIEFIINAIDHRNGEKTAYNTGTGIIDSHRGDRLVDKMYEHSLPLYLAAGITQCELEVVDINDRAIKVYERIGFEKTRRLITYHGAIESGPTVKLKLLPLEKINSINAYDHYSWDFTNTTALKAKKYYRLYEVLDLKDRKKLGHFVINSQNGTVAQLETIDGNWESIFSGISWVSKQIKINNIDEGRKELLDYLAKINLTNIINQFEMEMKI